MAKPNSTRRDFLRGKAAADALAEAADGPLTDSADPSASSGDPAADPGPACTLTLSRRAMACDFEVQLATNRHRNETPAGLAALDLIEELEDVLSVYRPSSEISRLNRLAALQATPAPAAMHDLLCFCEDLYHATDGAFDATTGPLSKAWGFYHRRPRVPSDRELAEAMDLVGWRHVRFDREAGLIQFAKPGPEINFNGIGKGYALDQAADLLTREGAADLLLHGGRSTLVARGNRPSGQPGWGVGLRHPTRPQVRIAEFALRDQAFSTSGSATQGFVHQGRRYGHVLDPRTGRPAEGVLNVSVLAPTGAEADALSTAFFVMGPEAADRYCQQRLGVSALFVLPGKHASQVQIEPLNLTPEQWSPATDT